MSIIKPFKKDLITLWLCVASGTLSKDEIKSFILKNKKWSPEEKERIVKRYFEGEISRSQLAKEEKVTDGMLHQWIKRYKDEGI
ncbi:transposase [Clostridium sp. VAP51]|uniref:transposase n=1 Tax=Clostridium sp. VAP51 TaxID=2949978 RepID=UPI00338E9482